MNHIRRICHSVTGLQRRVGVVLASSAVPPVVLAADPSLPPPGWHEHPPPLPAHTHTVVVGGSVRPARRRHGPVSCRVTISV